jgi:hypothetical protein
LVCYLVFRAPGTKYTPPLVLNVFFVRALDARLPSSSPTLTVNAVNPGYCYSELRRNFSGIRNVIDWVMEKTLALTTEEGSRQLVYSAVAGKEKDMRGAYISCSEVVEASDYALSVEGGKVQDRLWVSLHLGAT